MFLNDNDMVVCPYNASHHMLRKRLQSHLLKCRRNYPDVELKKCPFNITHLIPEPEFTHHATNCPDRKLITQYKFDAPEPKEDEGPKHAPIECDEDWDDTNVVDYNPRKYLEEAKIIRKPDGSKPSERKLFIKKERKRLGGGDSSSEDETKDNKSSIIKQQFDSSETSNFHYAYSKGRSRSPNKYNRDRSRSPVGFNRSYRNRSPPRRRSPDYSRNYSAPNNSYNSAQNDIYNKSGGTSSTYGSSFGGSGETSNSVPQAPPPPMISYPARRSYSTSYQSPPSSN